MAMQGSTPMASDPRFSPKSLLSAMLPDTEINPTITGVQSEQGKDSQINASHRKGGEK